MSASSPLVALVGRPNVGKSALFNRIVGARRAVVEDLPGTTRDRLYGSARWGAHDFAVVDTGGMEVVDSGVFTALVRAQAKRAVAEADVILFLVDVVTGPTGPDEDVAAILRQAKAPVVLVANKADNPERQAAARAEFYRLGLGEPAAVSSLHGTGVGDLLDQVVALLPPVAEEAAAEEEIAIAIVGRPNVGKSTLLNAILGEERMIVSAIPGTTRDAVDTVAEHEGRRLRLIDTAGIRRRGHIVPGVEKHSVGRTQDAIERCDVALLLLDGTEGVTAQDTHIAGDVAKAGKGLVVAVNKWDAMPTDANWGGFAQLLLQRLRFAPWAQTCAISAQDGSGIEDLLRYAKEGAETRRVRISTGELNRVVQRAVATHAPSSGSAGRLKILYATQADVSPPTFVFFVNDASLAHFSYRRYLENTLRSAFGFRGTAIRTVYRNREGDSKGG